MGGGASGLMAAGQAALGGADVVLLEKMSRPAVKLSITGKGRCNITNAQPIEDFNKHIRTNFRFLKHALYSFSNQDTIKFFNELGIKTITERGGRVFPASGKAVDICDALVKWSKNLGVKIFTNSCVDKLVFKQDKLIGVQTRAFARLPSKVYQADSVIIATGGASYPKTGSTGVGYKLSASIGHTIEPILAALVPLEVSGDEVCSLQGLSLRNIKASLWIDGRKSAEKFGDMLFTHFGLSGPVIISLSRYAVEAIDQNKKVMISIDLKPALDEQKLDARILRDIAESPKKKIYGFLKGLLPLKMINFCLDKTRIPELKHANQLLSAERKRLRIFFKCLEFVIPSYRPLSEAIITKGGVNVHEVNNKTMASKLNKEVYFAGEVLDVDADTGGYNLQIAFSTGWLAGRNSSKRH
ncbi:NAD(P)/FAD-dependent oxidoreductase [Candidatus Margulisiibacteriota bacterium]